MFVIPTTVSVACKAKRVKLTPLMGAAGEPVPKTYARTGVPTVLTSLSPVVSCQRSHTTAASGEVMRRN